MKLTKDQFLEMDINSMFEAGELFEGMSDEKVVWVCQERQKHPTRKTEVAVFGLYYEDIEIGRMRGELVGGATIDWKEVA